MAEPNLTPEEKLLRIIDTPADAVRRMRPQRRLQDFKLSLKLFKAQYGEKFKEFLNLRAVNAVLVVCAAIVTVFLALDFWLGLPSPEALQRMEQTAKKLDITELTIEHLEPVSVYLQEITQRNIFALTEALQEAPVPAAPQSPELTELTGTLKVVGILWSETPQVMIEDSKEGRTYLLNRGGQIRQARIKEILKDRVILSYDNKDIELR